MPQGHPGRPEGAERERADQHEGSEDREDAMGNHMNNF
jgi:hypothetical protein